MKLRQKPGDFIVEEINSLKPLPSGSYKLYLLEKSGLETFALFYHLSRQNNIPVREFGIAGLKDKHAVTKQFFTIPSKYDLRFMEGEGFTITQLGFLDRQLKLGDLKGNCFKITVRHLKRSDVADAMNRFKTLCNTGVPNYFDSQRFGSVMMGEFIARSLIKKDYEHAVKIFLTRYTRYESMDVKQEKRLISQNWRNLKNVRVRNRLFHDIISGYLDTGSWLKAYRKIPRSLKEMFISAYQGYIWNECVKQFIKKKTKDIFIVDYSIGELFFHCNKLDFPETLHTVAPGLKPTQEEKPIIDSILSSEGITIKDLDIKRQTGNFFKVHERKIMIMPENIKVSKPQPDELNDGFFRLTVEFSLPKGSYATIVTKRIFGK